jgi:hypothetical protein
VLAEWIDKQLRNAGFWLTIIVTIQVNLINVTVGLFQVVLFTLTSFVKLIIRTLKCNMTQ